MFNKTKSFDNAEYLNNQVIESNVMTHFCNKCAGFTIKIFCETLRFPGNLVPRFPVSIPPWLMVWRCCLIFLVILTVH